MSCARGQLIAAGLMPKPTTTATADLPVNPLTPPLLLLPNRYGFLRSVPRALPRTAPTRPLTPLLCDDGYAPASLMWLAQRHKFSQPYFASTELRQFTFQVRCAVRGAGLAAKWGWHTAHDGCGVGAARRVSQLEAPAHAVAPVVPEELLAYISQRDTVYVSTAALWS